MDTVSLLYTTGNVVVDAPLLSTVQHYEATFPEHVRGYYLLGSYADEHAVAGSDIDLYVLFKEAFLTTDEAEKARQLALSCAKMSDPRLEINLVDEQSLEHYHNIMRVALKRNSVLLYGKDTRPAMNLPSRETYQRDATDGVLEFILRLHTGDTISYPLSYPDPAGMFYGYDTAQRLVSTSATTYGTRLLLECAFRIATTLLVLKTGHFVGTKRESVQTYCKVINDEWNPFLTALFEQGKMQWGYGLPEHKEEQAVLHLLCGKMLVFENLYLLQYRAYLLTQLQSNDQQTVHFALQRLKTVHYGDQEIATAVS